MNLHLSFGTSCNMSGFIHQDFDLDQWFIDYNHFQNSPPLPYDQPLFFPPVDVTPAHATMNYGSPESFETFSDKSSEEIQSAPPPKKRQRQSSEESQSEGALVRSRKTRKLKAPHETAKVREKGACFLCQKKRKVVSLSLKPPQMLPLICGIVPGRR